MATNEYVKLCKSLIRKLVGPGLKQKPLKTERRQKAIATRKRYNYVNLCNRNFTGSQLIHKSLKP